MGEGTEPEPLLVARHPVGAGAISEEIHLLFLDAVLHFATLAVEILVKGASLKTTGTLCQFILEFLHGKIGDDEAGILAFWKDFEFGDDAPGTRPLTAYLVVKLSEAASG